MKLVLFVAIALLQAVLSSAFSVGFYPGSSKDGGATLVNTGSTFTSAPSAGHVADIYSRLSGLAPLLWEDEVNLPAAENVRARPLLVEVSGGALPASVTPVISSADAQSSASNLDEVVAFLKSRGVDCESKKVNAQEIQSFLKLQTSPVVILHHNAAPARRLQEETAGNSTVPLTEFEIAQYQICLWTAVTFVLLGLASICAMVNMDVVPDNLLYAKFQSGRTDKRD